MPVDGIADARDQRRMQRFPLAGLYRDASPVAEALDGPSEQEMLLVRIVCNVDIHPDDLRVAKLRDARMRGLWTG